MSEPWSLWQRVMDAKAEHTGGIDVEVNMRLHSHAVAKQHGE